MGEEADKRRGKPLELRWSCAVDAAIQLSPLERARLETLFTVEVVNLREADKKQLERYEMILIHSRISDDTLTAFRAGKYLGIRAHNTDYVNRDLAGKLGMEVRGIPQVGEVAVAEHTFALLFAVTKQLALSGQNIAANKWREGLQPNIELRGKTLGIIGYGAIGKEVALIARAFGMHVLVASRQPQGEQLSLEEVLRRSDIVTVHASTNGQSGPILRKEQFGSMREGAILIQTARGSLVDYDALETALRSGKLRGAGLDVFPEEPLRDSPWGDLPQVVCTPHVAYYTDETLSKMNAFLIDQAIAYYLDGGPHETSGVI